MRPWMLPVVAASFAGGILAAGQRTGGPDALPMLAAGVAIAVAVAVGAGPRQPPDGRGSNPLLAAAGLRGIPSPPGERERILAAAGIGTGPARPAWARRSRGWAALGVAGVVASSSFLGAGWGRLRRASPADLGPLAGRFVRFAGVAASDPEPGQFGWSMEVALDRAEIDGSVVEVSVRLWVGGSEEMPVVAAGQPVEGAGTIRPLDPGPSGFEASLLARGIVGTVAVTELEPRGPPRNPLLRVANGARTALRRGALMALAARESALLLGLSIGDTSRMDPEVEEDFRATGLGHLVAVSGENVAMVLIPVMALAMALRLSGGGRFALGVAAVVLFALMTRWEPSVLRASVMAVMGLAGVLAGRPRNTAALLGAAVLVLLVVDPGLATSVGFQLSVAATAGMAVLAAPIAARLRMLPRWAAIALAATIAAQLGVTPLLLLTFGVVPTVTLPANVLAFPAVAPGLLLGIASSAVSLVWPAGGRLLGHVAALFLSYLIGLADRLARAPFPSLTARGPALPLLVLAGAALLAWRLRRGRRRLGGFVAAAAAVAVAWSAAPVSGPPDDLTVTFFDVGQGDAALVRGPDGSTILIDAGPDEELVATDLARLGVRRLDLAVATHSHADHVEGFPAVFSRFPVALLLEPGCQGDSPSYAAFLEALDAEDIPVRHPREGERFQVGDLRVDVYGPEGCSPGGLEPNNESIVLRVSYGDATVLFPGDAEEPAQQDLLDDGDPVAADVLKVPHHGGDTSLRSFFEAVDARLAVVSVGPNDYGHPVASVLRTIAGTGATVLRTDLEGDITVEVRGDEVLVESAGSP